MNTPGNVDRFRSTYAVDYSLPALLGICQGHDKIEFLDIRMSLIALWKYSSRCMYGFNCSRKTKDFY